MKNVSHDYNRCRPLSRNSYSFADKVMDVSLVQLVPSAIISNTSCSFLDTLSGYLAKNLVSSNDWKKGQQLTCVVAAAAALEKTNAKLNTANNSQNARPELCTKFQCHLVLCTQIRQAYVLMIALANMRWQHEQPPSGHLATHCRPCFCSQSFDDPKFLARY